MFFLGFFLLIVNFLFFSLTSKLYLHVQVYKPYHIKSVQVVYISVFSPSIMLYVLVEGYFRSVEHGRLIHVVPDVQIWRATTVLRVLELGGPPVSDLRVDKVWPT